MITNSQVENNKVEIKPIDDSFNHVFKPFDYTKEYTLLLNDRLDIFSGMTNYEQLEAIRKIATIKETGELAKDYVGHLMPVSNTSDYRGYASTNLTRGYNTLSEDERFLGLYNGDTLTKFSIEFGEDYRFNGLTIAPKLIFPSGVGIANEGSHFFNDAPITIDLTNIPLIADVNNIRSIYNKGNSAGRDTYTASIDTDVPSALAYKYKFKSAVLSDSAEYSREIIFDTIPNAIKKDNIVSFSFKQTSVNSVDDIVGNVEFTLEIVYKDTEGESQTFTYVAPLSAFIYSTLQLENVGSYLERIKGGTRKYKLKDFGDISVFPDATSLKRVAVATKFIELREKYLNNEIEITSQPKTADNFTLKAIRPLSAGGDGKDYFGVENLGVEMVNKLIDSDSNMLLDNFQVAPNLYAYDYILANEKDCVQDYNGEWVLNPLIKAHEDLFIYGYGSLGDKNNNASIKFIDKWVSVEMGDSIEATYKAKVDEGNADLINKCKFGIQFGVKGSSNRLFVSGNPNFKNMDWHSSDTNESDFTYFEDGGYNPNGPCAYGNDNTAIVGYGIVADGKLLVAKERDNQSPSIFYRTGTTIATLEDTDLGVGSINRERFPMLQSNSKIGGVASYQFTDYCGDSIFVSDEGEIVGLDNADTSIVSNKIASSRSELIDKEIKPKKSVDNLLISSGNTLYYATDDCLYTCDYSNKYGWFKTDLKGISAYCDVQINGVETLKVFGDKQGRVMFETKNRFIDEDVDEIELDDKRYIFVGSDSKLHYSNTFEADYLNNADEYILSIREVLLIGLKEGIHYSVLVDQEHGTILSSETIKEGMLLTDGEGHYGRVHLIDNEYDKFYVDNINDFESISCLYPTKRNVDLKVMPNEEGIIDFGEELDRVSGVKLIRESIVKSFYIPAPFTAQDLSTLKSIWSITLCSDVKEESHTKVAMVFDTYTMSNLVGDLSDAKAYNYNDLSYSNVSFRKYELPRVNILYQPVSCPIFTCKLFSDTGDNSVLTEMQIQYSLPKRQNKGV